MLHYRHLVSAMYIYIYVFSKSLKRATKVLSIKHVTYCRYHHLFIYTLFHFLNVASPPQASAAQEKMCDSQKKMENSEGCTKSQFWQKGKAVFILEGLLLSIFAFKVSP